MAELAIETEANGASEPVAVRNMIFASPADDARARRTADWFVLVTSVLITLLGLWSYNSDSALDRRVGDFFDQGYPGWISAVLTILFVLGALYAIALMVVIGLYRNGRWPVFRDMFLAFLIASGVVIGASMLAGPEWPDVVPELRTSDGIPSYPLYRISVTLAIITVAAPYLSLPMRRVGRRLLLAMMFSSVVLGYGSLTTVLGAGAVGLGVAATIHLMFGSPVGIPSKARILDAMRAIRLEPTDVEYLDEQPVGATLVRGWLEDGDEVLVKVYGRDAADAATAARTWRSVWYRDSGSGLRVGSLQQVEHEALMLLEGARSDAPVPELVGWGRGDADDALIATRWLDGQRLSDLGETDVDAAMLASCWQALVEMHGAGIAHREIDRSHVVFGRDGVVIDGLQGAHATPDDFSIGVDIGQMLVSTTLAVGADRAIAAARGVVGDEALFDAIPMIQASVLSNGLQRDIRESKLKLKDVRNATAEALEVEVPGTLQLERITWSNVAMTLLTLLAAYALIGMLTDIGVDTIVDEMSNAKWSWVLAAFVMAQLTNVGEYITLSAMVPGNTPFGPTMVFRYALSFISLAVPSEAGAIAMNIRYMQKLGVSASAAIAQGPLLTIFSKSFDVLLLILAGRIAGAAISWDDIDSGPVFKMIALVIVLVVVGVILTFAVPKLRKQVMPHLSEGFGAVKDSVTNPERLLRICTGTLLQKILFALTLTAAVAAYGGSLTFVQAVFVNSAVSLLVGLMPVPGGIGVAEAALTAGLTAVGVPEGIAVAAAITHRIVTAYLPPMFGFFAMRWMTERDYL